MEKMNEYDLSNASDVMNFNREVVEFINNNLRYMKEVYEKLTGEDCYEYYKLSVEMEDIYLNEQQIQQFIYVSNFLLKEGYYPHAGTLNN